MTPTTDHVELADPFRAAAVPARWVIGLMAVTLLLAAGDGATGVAKLQWLGLAESGGASLDAFQAFNALHALIALVRLIVWVATASAFLAWFYRSHRNLTPLRASPIKYGSGWTIGGFFVPFLNLVRPMQVMREVWHGSNPATFDPDPSGGPSFGPNEATPALVGWWWGLFLVSGLVDNVAIRAGFGADGVVERLRRLAYLMAFSDALDVVAVVIVIFLVRRITAWQAERAARIAETQVSPIAMGVVGASGFEPLTPAV